MPTGLCALWDGSWHDSDLSSSSAWASCPQAPHNQYSNSTEVGNHSWRDLEDFGLVLECPLTPLFCLILHHPSSKPTTDILCSGKLPTLSRRWAGVITSFSVAPPTVHTSPTVLSTCPEGSVVHLWRLTSPGSGMCRCSCVYLFDRNYLFLGPLPLCWVG